VQTKSLVLNLSGLSNGNVVIVNMDARTITVGGTDTMSLYVSGDYWMIEPGNNAIALANTTNATTVVSYRPAWSL
jgi:phage-related protein